MSVARLPISWYDLTRIQLDPKVYAIENDKEELVVTVTEKLSMTEREKTILETTRVPSDRYPYCIAELVSTILTEMKIPTEVIRPWIIRLRRRVNLDVLEEISIYLEQNNIEPFNLSSEFDSLRSRLSKLRPAPLDIQHSTSDFDSEQFKNMPQLIESPLTQLARVRPLSLKDIGFSDHE